MKDIYASAIQAAKEKISPFGGGRDIMKRLVEKLRTIKKEKPEEKGYFTDGWGILKKWQERKQKKPSQAQPDGFDVMQLLVKHPVPIKKEKESLMKPIEVNPPKSLNNKWKFSSS